MVKSDREQLQDESEEILDFISDQQRVVGRAKVRYRRKRFGALWPLFIWTSAIVLKERLEREQFILSKLNSYHHYLQSRLMEL